MEGATDRAVARLPRSLTAALAEGRLCGRAAELAAASAALTATHENGPTAVVLSGDPGVGKTRLAAQLADAVQRRGHRVLYGRCQEGLDGAYQPVAECLDQLGSGWPAAAGRQAGGRPGERYLLFDAVRAALEDASRERPLVLILEDLHWADEATLLLLAHVLSAPQAPNAAFLLTHRPGELREAAAFAAMLGEAERRDAVLRLRLVGLAVADVFEIVREHSADQLSPAIAEQLWRDAGGNPFFIKQILRSEGLGATPPGVREVIRRRAAVLGDGVAAILALAAVAGRDLDAELLSAAGDHSVGLVLDAMDAAERAGLLTARGGGGLQFAHALIQQALYEELPPARRGALHGRVARALEGLPATPSGERVLARARHELAALPADSARVATATLAAGLLSLERRDPDAAARLFRQALAATDHTHDDAVTVEALIGLGGALLATGDPEARAFLLRASRLALRRGDRDALVRAVLRNNRGLASAIGEVDAERVAMLEAASEAVGPQDSADRALLLNTLATELYFSREGTARSLALSEEAVAVARRVADPHTLATVLAPRQAPWSPEGIDAQGRGTEESLALADRLGDPHLQFRALRWRQVALLLQGRVDEAKSVSARQERLAQQSGDPVARFLSTHDRIAYALIGGRLAEADALAQQTLADGAEAGQPDALAFYANALCAVRHDQGRLGELVELTANAVSRSPHVPAQQAILALAYADAGFRDDAAAVLDRHRAAGFDAVLPRDSSWLVAVSAFAHVAADLADRDAAVELFELLVPWHGHMAWNSAVWGAVDLALGRLALTTGRLDDAEAYLARARAQAERWGAPVWLARTELEEARLRLALGDDEGALALLEPARAAAARLGADGVARTAGALLQRTRSAHALAASGNGMPTAATARPPARRPAELATLTRDGEIWTITHRGARVGVPDAKGLRYLAILITHPGVERHVASLQAGVSGEAMQAGDAGPLLDEQARSTYQHRLEDLDEALEEAERFGDHERASQARAEREAIGRELAVAVGRTGQTRRAGDPVERARVNVTRALKRAVARIEAGDPALGHHLRRSLRTGEFCVYDPSPSDRVVWRVG